MEAIDTTAARLNQALAVIQALPVEQEPEASWANVQGALWAAGDLLEQAQGAVASLGDLEAADLVTARIKQARSILQVLPVEGEPEASWPVVRGALWAAETLIEQAVEAVPEGRKQAA